MVAVFSLAKHPVMFVCYCALPCIWHACMTHAAAVKHVWAPWCSMRQDSMGKKAMRHGCKAKHMVQSVVELDHVHRVRGRLTSGPNTPDSHVSS